MDSDTLFEVDSFLADVENLQEENEKDFIQTEEVSSDPSSELLSKVDSDLNDSELLLERVNLLLNSFEDSTSATPQEEVESIDYIQYFEDISDSLSSLNTGISAIFTYLSFLVLFSVLSFVKRFSLRFRKSGNNE